MLRLCTLLCYLCVFCFFFQAEDGIRDLVRSRGLGDVYKRQQYPGSWWTDWSNWLAGQAGKKIASPKAYGKGKYRAIEPAPGRHVNAKA